MKNIEIKEMNAVQREVYMLMSVKTWQAMVMEDIITGQCNQTTEDVTVKELRLRIKLMNNMRMMHGKKPYTANQISRNIIWN